MSKFTKMSDTENIYGMIGGQKIPILRKIPEIEGGNRRKRSPSPRRSPRRRSPSPGRRSPNKTVNKTVIKTKPNGTVVKKTVTRSPSPRRSPRKRSPSPGRRSPNKTVNKTVIKTKPDGTVVKKTVTRSPSPGRRSPNKTVVNKTVNKTVIKNRSPSPKRCGQKGQAAFFEHCDFSGAKICLRPGMYYLDDLRKRGLGNDKLSSVRPNGFMVKLYEHNGSGKTILLTESTRCLKTKILERGIFPKSWNDRVSAIRVIDPNARASGCMIL